MFDKYYENIDEVIGYSHNSTLSPGTQDFHLHDRYEIYFFISGDVTYFIENKVHKLEYGDLLIMNNHEIHRPSIKYGDIYERIVIHFDPSLPGILSPKGYDLLYCFENRKPGEGNRLRLDNVRCTELIRLFDKIESLSKTPYESSKVLKLAYFLEVLVYVRHLYSGSRGKKEHERTPEKLIPILEYINENLDGDLSLRELEEKFYIDRYYLSRLFKKSTGSSLHEYIIYKRLSKAKQLLGDGANVTDAAMMSGFHDYSNFIRMFKRVVGTSPGRYKKGMR